MKKIFMSMAVLLIFTLAACSDDEATPQDRFDTYIDHWNKQEFNKMYEMISQKSAKTYATKAFVDRYKKIYGDLSVSDLKITAEKLDEEKLKASIKEGKAIIPFSVKMQTIAGPIEFDSDATLIKEGEEDNENWYVKWDPSFIFPEIKDGGKLSLETEEPKRGEILDRNRMPLAINDVVYEIGIVPNKLEGNADAMKSKIADLLGMSVESINAKLNADWVEPELFVPLTKIPKTNEKTLNQLWQLAPIMGREVTGRVYPHDKAAAHLIGYVGKVTADDLKDQKDGTYTENDMIGKRGLEKLYEKQLRGEKGAKITVTNDDNSSVVLAEKSAKDGENIVTTIDVELQDEIFASYDGMAGSTAAINPKTGETLALVSSPSFDPNQMVYGISQKDWDTLQNDPKKPLINRFASTYAPGSVLKPITAAIGLQNGSIVPGKGVKIDGLDWSNGKGWGDYKVHRVSTSSKPVDVMDALIRSDNIYFAMKAVDMGTKAFTKGLKQFGFGDKIPLDYQIEKSTISPDGKIANEVQLADSAYGQGKVQTSALYLASAYTAFLNDGNMLKPTLLADEKTGQIWKKDLLNKDNLKLLQDALRKVITAPRGTGRLAKKAGFAISGKTGTAELKKSADEKNGQENGWFVAYPTDKPDVLISMMVEHVEGKGGSNVNVEKVTNVLKAIH